VCVCVCVSECPLSQPYVATGHTSAFISRIFAENMEKSQHTNFSGDAPITCPVFNLVRNSIVHSPPSVIRDPRYGNVSTYLSVDQLNISS